MCLLHYHVKQSIAKYNNKHYNVSVRALLLTLPSLASKHYWYNALVLLVVFAMDSDYI